MSPVCSAAPRNDSADAAAGYDEADEGEPTEPELDLQDRLVTVGQADVAVTVRILTDDDHITFIGVGSRLWPVATWALEQLLFGNIRMPPAANPQTLAEQQWPAIKLAGARVVTVGAGVGLLGMGLALHGACRVVLTDQPWILPLTKRNIAANFNSHAGDGLADAEDQDLPSAAAATGGGPLSIELEHREGSRRPCRPTVATLRWGHGPDYAGLPGPYDLVCGTDITYLKRDFDKLLATLGYLRSAGWPLAGRGAATVIVAVATRERNLQMFTNHASARGWDVVLLCANAAGGLLWLRPC